MTGSNLICLAALVDFSDSNLNELEKLFVSRIFIQEKIERTIIFPRMKPASNPQNEDIIDDVSSSKIWEKISSVMGEQDFQGMWRTKFVFYEVCPSLHLSLNGHLNSSSNFSSFVKSKASRSIRTSTNEGYNPRMLIDRKTLRKTKIPSDSQLLIPIDYQSVREMILNQNTGAHCKDLSNEITPHQEGLLKQFLKKDFKLSFFKQKLLQHTNQGSSISVKEITASLTEILDTYVPRSLIGSKKIFDKMKVNICRFLEMNLRYPVRMGMLMKGLKCQKNLFLSKFMLFLTSVFAVRLIYKVFYVTESLKKKQVLFFKKKAWATYEKNALLKMVNSGVLASSLRDSRNSTVSRLHIIHKPKGFRPLVVSSVHHRKTRFRLSVCNAFLKQIVNQINPGYGRLLNDLHSQWSKLRRCSKDKLYFIRTDVMDAFQSIDHGKLHEILNRRLSGLDPVQTCRTIEFNARGRKKSILHFTKIQPRISKKKIFFEPGKKVYTTSYLKAVILQFIKQNYVTINGKSVFHHIKGLPQGCLLSSVLCELYLADMDDCCLSHLKGENDIMIRGVDDYLFLTYDSQKAENFLQIISSGILEYGITFQLTKTIANVGSPITCFPFFGYIFHPKTRKIEPDFSEWTDITARIYLNPKMSWKDLARRMKMVTHIKLHGLILDSDFLDKFVIMRNVFQCAKIHAAKYKAIHNFLLENCEERPALKDKLIPILAAARLIACKATSINKGKMGISYLEAKFIVLKGFTSVLQLKGPFRNVVEELNVAIGRLLTRGCISTRSKKLLKSLVKNNGCEL